MSVTDVTPCFYLKGFPNLKQCDETTWYVRALKVQGYYGPLSTFLTLNVERKFLRRNFHFQSALHEVKRDYTSKLFLIHTNWPK